MNILTLKVEGSLPGEIIIELHRPPNRELLVETKTELTVEEIKQDPIRLTQLLPQKLTRELEQWVLDDSEPGLLAIISESNQMDGIPWEYLPQVLNLSTVFVVRYLAELEPFVIEPTSYASRLLAAGWSGKPTFKLPGIQKELAALNTLGTTTDFQVQVLFEPNLGELTDAWSTFSPDLLHLIPAGINHNIAMPEMALSGDQSINLVPIDRFLQSLPGGLQPRLVVLNTCSGGEGGSGPPAIRLIAEHLRTMAIGWLGTIQDDAATDFARFIYARILDGETIINALRSYRSIQSSRKNFEQATRHVGPMLTHLYNPVPVIWTPAMALLAKSLRPPSSEDATAASQLAAAPKSPLEGLPQKGQPSRAERQPRISYDSFLPALTVEFEPHKWLNPALLKNGRPAINRLVLTTDRAIRNVGIAISCDTGNGMSIVRQTINLEKGPQPIAINTWQFPVLYELITMAVPRRQINFTVSCTLAGRILAETTTSVLWMGRTEWLDKADTWVYIPAFVDPYCEGVLDVVGKADDVLKKIVAPTSNFSAYATKDMGFVVKQVEAIFNCLRDKPFEIRYIAPPPIPVYVPGEHLASGQRIRPSTEVVERCRGTCHDLAVLFASCLEHIQIYPLIILSHGHTFFGFWKDDMTHFGFWEQARNNRLRRPQDPGREWTITDLAEIQDLVDSDIISLVEATTVTDRNATFEKALKAGWDQLHLPNNDPPLFDVAIDIQASRYAIQPL